MASLRFGLRCVDRIDESVRVCVAHQNTHRDGDAASAAKRINYVIELDVESLRSRDSAHIHGALICVRPGNNAATCRRSSSTVRDVVCESKDH